MAIQGARYAERPGDERFARAPSRTSLGSRGRSQWWQRVLDPPRLAEMLGWFSIALGLAEVVAPRQLAKLIGAPKRTGLIRTFGVREIASGVGILTTVPKPVMPTWSRVVGDLLDLASLG